MVSGDEARLRQVIGNLVTNALTHTPPDTPVTGCGCAPSGDHAVIEVADTGPGLTPEQAERVFERFYRADEARTRRADGQATGTGLGLAIVAALVAAHQGTVEVARQPGGGCHLPGPAAAAAAGRDGARRVTFRQLPGRFQVDRSARGKGSAMTEFESDPQRRPAPTDAEPSHPTAELPRDERVQSDSPTTPVPVVSTADAPTVAPTAGDAADHRRHPGRPAAGYAALLRARRPAGRRSADRVRAVHRLPAPAATPSAPPYPVSGHPAPGQPGYPQPAAGQLPRRPLVPGPAVRLGRRGPAGHGVRPARSSTPASTPGHARQPPSTPGTAPGPAGAAVGPQVAAARQRPAGRAGSPSSPAPASPCSP